MKKIIYLLLTLVLLVGCKSAKHLATTEVVVAPQYLSSKLQLTLPANSGGLTVGGTMKLKSGERAQISVQMPIIRSEVARIEITPDEVLLIDRMNKRYVRATKEELKNILPKNAQFAKLEKLLLDASLPGGKDELSGKELGIPSMEKAKVKLYDFSSKEFIMTPTEISSKYMQVPLEDFIKMLLALLS